MYFCEILPQNDPKKNLKIKKKVLETFVQLMYSSDSRRSNIARGKKANKQISLANQGLTRSIHWSRAISKTSFLYFFEFLTQRTYKFLIPEKF